ncbi:MAG: site-specific DNA-methyltransferase [Chloroflexi bacterium]|nr:site-specific DNA-methyltransferase [Chloroflexota bacterium]
MRLEFEGKHYIYGHHLTVPISPLIPDYEKSAVGADGGYDNENLIIHGDNLYALKSLLPKYAGRVKCIYIDPPYNTGNEGWKYNDRVNSPTHRAWFQEEVGRDDLERHDKWLCMMWPRLLLLRELLSDDGAIFISIDDNEVNHLWMLMDEIFGEENFVANIVWRKKAGGGQDSEYLAREHEYIVMFRKSEKFRVVLRSVATDPGDFKKTKNGRKCKFIKLEKWGSGALRTDRPTLFYPIMDPDGYDFFPQAPSGAEGRWRKQPETLDDDHIHWEKRRGRWTPLEVVYLDESPTSKKIKDRTIYYDVATTTDAANEQKSIFGKKMLDNSKPSALIRRLVRLVAREDELVLDSFAGSGTTAHAVLALNKTDGGNRRFILVECMNYADDITAERVRRVVCGVPNAKDDALKEGLGGSFTYYTLGEPLNNSKMLSGESLPSYRDMAVCMYHTATGQAIDPASVDISGEKPFYQDRERDFWLFYKPDLEWLKGSDSTFSERLAERVAQLSENAVVFASHKYMPQRYLSEMGITFCQIPFAEPV